MVCHEGQCYMDANICGFDVTVSGQGGANTYTFYNDGTLPPGTQLTLTYVTYNIPDNIVVSGNGVSSSEYDGCVSTGPEPEDPYTLLFTIGTGNEIVVTVTTCGSTSSKFHFTISCPDEFQNDPPSDRMVGVNGGGVEGIKVHPNPFVSNIDITAANVENPFVGQVVLLDNLGREVLSREFAFEAGHNSMNIDGLEGLGEGLYIILVRKDGEVYASRKVVKLE